MNVLIPCSHCERYVRSHESACPFCHGTLSPQEARPVARALVPLLRPFGVTIAAYSAGVPAALMQQAGITPAESLHALFADSEVLFECEALTPATQGCVTAELLGALPDDAVFVNVGRGQVVEEAALVHEARSGRLRLALDVPPVVQERGLGSVACDIELSAAAAAPSPPLP